VAIRIRGVRRRMHVYRDRETGEILLSEEKAEYPEYEYLGEIEVEE
jgi:hypothetical protein